MYNHSFLRPSFFLLFIAALGISLSSGVLWPVPLTQAQSLTAIEGNGLGTAVGEPQIVPEGTVYNITGGTRAGTNLFHSFELFSVGTGHIANFQNTSVNGSFPVTDNILSRVTGGTPSEIFGTLRTTDFGNANLFLLNPSGIIFGPGASLDLGAISAVDGQRGVGSFYASTADYIRLSNGQTSGYFYADPLRPNLLTSAPVAAYGFLGLNAAAIAVQGSTLEVSPGQNLSLVGGDRPFDLAEGGETAPGVTLTGGTVRAPAGQIILASVASPGEILLPHLGFGTNVNNEMPSALGRIELSQGALASVSGDGGGTIRIRGGQLLMDSSTVSADTVGDIHGAPVAISINVTDTLSMSDLSAISSFGLGGTSQPGDIHILADNNTVLGGASFIGTLTAGENGGNINIGTRTLALNDSSALFASNAGSGIGANISIAATESLVVSGIHPEFGIPSSIVTDAGQNPASGALYITGGAVLMDSGVINSFSGGAINLNIRSLSITNLGAIETFAGPTSGAGKITVSAQEAVNISGHLDDQTFSRITANTSGDNGGIFVTAKDFSLTDGAQIRNESTTLTIAAPVTIHADESITVTGGARIVNRIDSAFNSGAGPLELSARSVLIGDHAIISTATTGDGPAGDIRITATNGSIDISSGSVVDSATEQGLGQGGTLAITASDSVSLSDGARVTSNSSSAGNAGAIQVTAENSVSLLGNGTGLFTQAFAQGSGGTISVNGNQVRTSNGAVFSATSTGSGNAGDISIDAGQSFIATNSSVTTQANQASGGSIKITTDPSGTVELSNSTISASVLDGAGGSGSVDIDPQYVLLQNSQILAQAVQGPGGNITITITNGGLFLPDANSVVSASSQFGVNGTVTIQSPNAPASGQIQPLGQSPLLATSLFNQHCAALAGGEFSSFTVAGRDSLPTEPGSWLASPLNTLSAGTGFGVKAEGGRPVTRGEGPEGTMLGTSSDGETPLLSLRQIAPAGFLTQAFAVDRSASCQS